MNAGGYVEVLLDQSLQRPLDYSIPAELAGKIEIGSRVEVPLRSKLVKATVINLKDTSNTPITKPIARLLQPDAALSESLWRLAQWMAEYYATPLQKVLKCFIPPSLRKEVRPQQRLLYTLKLSRTGAAETIAQLRSQQPLHAEILERLLQSPKGIPASLLQKELNISRSPLQTLAARGWITPLHTTVDTLEDDDYFPSLPKVLNPEQQQCLDPIVASLRSGRFAAHLIQGVTGSGKTEVYMQAISACLAQGRSALMLVPEIALTSQTIERFRARFQEKIALWHHRRSLGERKAAWDALKSGTAQIVIGARSAIFCPVQNIGLILVDEEHDNSYKQSEEMPCYHGRDVAVMRAKIEQATIVLGSATPALESRYNSEQGKYTLHRLTLRATTAALPKVTLVDMRRELDVHGGFTHFSAPLIEALKLRIAAGEQTLLFLNRRGYHRLQVCASCQQAVKCPHCDLGLTFHKAEHQLRCHLCDHAQPVPPTCPQCGTRESLQFKGFGTEHVERSLQALLPEVRTLRMDRDTTRQKTSHEEIYQQFRAHKADVLIGTQMIAKGFHFPSATLVGILNLDGALHIPDFRAAEQAFQLLTQVSGRAGRAELAGEVILQTFLPDHPLFPLAAAQDYDSFYQTELAERRLFSYPPFCRLIKITCSDPDPVRAAEAAHALHAQLSPRLPPDTQLLPVLPSGHPRIKDNYRFQFIIKTLKISLLHPILRLLSSPCSYKIDVDPISIFF